MADNELSVNYEAVLADLIARRDKLNAAIAAVEAIIGSGTAVSVAVTGVSATASTGNVGTVAATPIESDAFFNLSVPDATRKLLKMRKRPQSTQEIAAALEAGGVLHQSANFANTVGAVLARIDKGGGDIVKLDRAKFGLAEWYPMGKRRRPDNGSENQP